VQGFFTTTSSLNLNKILTKKLLFVKIKTENVTILSNIMMGELTCTSIRDF